MTVRRSYLLLAACLTCCILTWSRAAHALKYKPQPEETLSHIALIHYGDPKKYIYLSAANGIVDPDKVPRGRTLWVPTVWKYRIKRGDSLSRIAAKHLKDSERADFLMWLNRIKDPKDIEPGTQITIPFLLKHRVQQGQTMVDVARRYYFRINKVTLLLRKFNNKRTNALKPGELLHVPIFDKDAQYEKVKERVGRYEEKLAKASKEAREMAKRRTTEDSGTQETDAKSSADAGGQTEGSRESVVPESISRILEGEDSRSDSVETRPADADAIQRSFRLYLDGEYERARANLEKVLDDGVLSKTDEAEAREILAFCLVAMDYPKEAEHEFVRLLMVAPERTLDPVTTSPKILKIFERAKGAQ